MANASKPGEEPDLNFDQLFAEEQPPAGAAKGQGGTENLQELEAFLDEFEKNLGEPQAAAPTAPAQPAAAAEPSFNEPQGAEELVHGLLKEDELNLDVQGTEPAAPAPAVDAPTEFEPQPLRAPAIDIPAFIHAAPAANGKPVPAAAAGFSRIGFILALVLGGVALLVAIGAGWMALNATQAVQGMEMHQGGGANAGQDARLTKLQTDVTALHKQVEELSHNLEGSMTDLHNRVAALEKASGMAPATEATPTGKAEPAPAAAANATATAKPAAPDAGKPQPGKPAPVAEASKAPAAPATAAASAAKPAPAAPAAAAPAAKPGPAPQGAKPAAGPQAAMTAPAAPAPAPAPSTTAQPAAPAQAAQPAPTAQAAQPAATPAKPAVSAQAAPVKPAAPPKAKKAGDWVVHLTSSDEKRRAQAQLAHARAQGMDARLTTGTVEGKTWYRVTVEGFATADAARAYVASQAQAAGFSTAWIARR